MLKDWQSLDRVKIDQADSRDVPIWVVFISAFLALVAGLALFFLSVSLLLIATPIIAVIFLYIRWKIKKALSGGNFQSPQNTIEGDYTIIDENYER